MKKFGKSPEDQPACDLPAQPAESGVGSSVAVAAALAVAVAAAVAVAVAAVVVAVAMAIDKAVAVANIASRQGSITAIRHRQACKRTN